MIPALDTFQSDVDSTEYFLTTLHLLVNLMGAFKDIGSAFRTIGSAKGVAVRVDQLLIASSITSSQHKEDINIEMDKALSILFEDVEIRIPVSSDEIRLRDEEEDESLLIQPFTLRIKQGESVLIQGENGVGKSSLFRVMRGIWPTRTGKLSILVDEDRVKDLQQVNNQQLVYFLPQRAYIVKNKSLREQLTYPNEVDFAESAVNDVIDFIRISADANSSNYFGGEKQRIEVGRMLLRNPVFVCLDEATSNCTSSFEDDLFMKLQEMKITSITISHRVSPIMRSVHSKTILFNKDKTISVL